jgi:hypothetical protein
MEWDVVANCKSFPFSVVVWCGGSVVPRVTPEKGFMLWGYSCGIIVVAATFVEIIYKLERR